MGNIYTIGYGNVVFNDFFKLLKKYNIRILVDIRSRPYSKHRPEYQKKNLETEIIGEGMKYHYLGDKLGGMPEDRKFYDSHGYVDYKALAKDASYLDGIRQIIDLSLEKNICLMCAEAGPERCHRSLLVSETLWKHGIKSLHILHEGSILRHEALRERLAPDQGDLFDGAG